MKSFRVFFASKIYLFQASLKDFNVQVEFLCPMSLWACFVGQNLINKGGKESNSQQETYLRESRGHYNMVTGLSLVCVRYIIFRETRMLHAEVLPSISTILVQWALDWSCYLWFLLWIDHFDFQEYEVSADSSHSHSLPLVASRHPLPSNVWDYWILVTQSQFGLFFDRLMAKFYSKLDQGRPSPLRPWCISHLFQISPYFRKIFRLWWCLLFPKNFLIFIRQNFWSFFLVIDHKFRIFPLFNLFHYISPLFRENYYSPLPLEISFLF